MLLSYLRRWDVTLPCCLGNCSDGAVVRVPRDQRCIRGADRGGIGLAQNQETSLGKGCRGIPCRSARCPRIFFSFPKSFGEKTLGKQGKDKLILSYIVHSTFPSGSY